MKDKLTISVKDLTSNFVWKIETWVWATSEWKTIDLIRWLKWFVSLVVKSDWNKTNFIWVLVWDDNQEVRFDLLSENKPYFSLQKINVIEKKTNFFNLITNKFKDDWKN